jgi:hypothetical protein
MLFFLSLLCGVASKLSTPERFVHWAVRHADQCGTPGASVTVLSNLYPCVSDLSAVFALFTIFEGEPHTFGITACSDDQIYIGLRREETTMVYMEFTLFEEFLAFMDE